MFTILKRKWRRAMTLQEFKSDLRSQKCPSQCYLFLCKEDHFLANMYVKHYTEMMKYQVEYIETLEDLIDLASYPSMNEPNVLFVSHIDKIEVELPSILKSLNCIIVCDELINKGDFTVIEFPKVESWQLEDYAKTKLKGLDERKIKWLFELLKDNPYRLDQEIAKISLFSEGERDHIFDLMNEEGAFDDITNLTTFSLINAISRKNKKEIVEVLEVIKLIDIDPYGLITLLLKQFKNIVDVKMGTLHAKDIGMSDKQYLAIKKYNLYSPNELVNIMDLLTEVDYRIKSGELPIDLVIDYLICNIMK